MKHALLLATFLVTAACSSTGDAPVSSAPLVDHPLDVVEGLPVVEVGIGGAGPLNFVVDTGFDVSVIDAETAAEAGLSISDVTIEAQPGGAVEMGELAPVDVRLGSFSITDVQLVSAPLRGLSAFLGRDLDGIIGHDVLARFVVELDHPGRRMRLYEPSDWTAPAGARALRVRIVAAQPFVQGVVTSLDGRRVEGSFKLDTGSVDVAGLNLNFVRDEGVLAPEQEQLVVGGIAVGGGTEGRLFRARALELGAHREEAPLLGYTTFSDGFEERDNAGTVGAAVLSRYRLVLDYPHERVWLVGAPGARRPENRAGMILVSPEPGVLLAALVVQGGPADEAGLREGDRLLALDGRDDLTLAAARALLTEDGPLDVVYARDDELARVRMLRRTLLPLASSPAR